MGAIPNLSTDKEDKMARKLNFDPDAKGYSYGASLAWYRSATDIWPDSDGWMSDLHGNEYVKVVSLNNPCPWLVSNGNATRYYKVVKINTDLQELNVLLGEEGSAGELAEKIRELVGSPLDRFYDVEELEDGTHGWSGSQILRKRSENL